MIREKKWSKYTQISIGSIGSLGVHGRFERLFDDLGVVGFRGSRVDQLRVMRDHRLDEALLQQLVDRSLGQRTANLQTLAQDGRCDEFVARHFLRQLIVGGLIEQHQVVELVTNFAL